jgi:hypothetical protein
VAAASGNGIIGELDIAYSSPDEFGRIAMAWLGEGITALAGDIGDEILAGPPLKPYWHQESLSENDPRFHVSMPPLWGDVSVLYPPRNMHYAKPYSATSRKRLEDLAPVMTDATVTLSKQDDGIYRSCWLQVLREGDNGGLARVILWISPASEGADITAGRAEIAFLRSFAERHVTVFGHVSPATSAPDWRTQLEEALRLRVRDTLTGWGVSARGYSWVTVLPSALASRLGGADGLRAAGAFETAAEVAGGSVWLQATSRWREYCEDRAAVDRVFEALAPVLPPGKPRSGQPAGNPAPGTRTEIIPYLLSIRDAAGFRPRS